MTDLERFETKYMPEPNSGCWLWIAGLFSTGYAQFYSSTLKRSTTGHAFAYQQFVGDRPPGLELDHLCRVRSCVNPGHLEAVPHSVNVQRGESGIRQRSKTHCKNGHPYDKVNTILVPCRTKNCIERRCRICSERAFAKHVAKPAIREKRLKYLKDYYRRNINP